MSKPREFWIHDLGANCFNVHTEKPDYFSFKTVKQVHVIEKQAADNLAECLERYKKGIYEMKRAFERDDFHSVKTAYLSWDWNTEDLKKYRGSDD